MIQKQSSTTKLRIVFDGSTRQLKSNSLNDCLYKGANIGTESVAQLLRFRLGRFVILADIQEAFLQISVNEADRDFTRFLWVDNDGDVVSYRFARVPFGLSCSPYLLNATIRHHLLINDAPVQNCFYVDDMILTAKNEEDAQLQATRMKQLMECREFTLRKWSSNCMSLATIQN